ncbi:MAG: efflux RND transporter periplasmic adaptor subunit [Tannerellaceae bacterium]|nr:efflux RND transporter periplasmic adaptor subunit [Tannerellaceae bacterium]
MKTTEVLKLIPFAAIAMLISCSGEKKENVENVEEVQVKSMVRVETVHTQDVAQLHEFTATVEANITNNIAPQMAARIERVLVEVGDYVSKGQLLAQMDQSSLQQSKIQLENLEIEFNRIDELYKVGGASRSAWDAQKTALDVARTALVNLEENTKLVSPISGIVTARNYDSGDLYAGNPLFVVEQIRPVKLIVHVSESFYSQIKKGNDVDIRLDVYGDEVFKGKVSLVYPTIDSNTRTFPVEIQIPNANERVRPGMFARVTMDFGTKNHVVAPDLAIVKQSGSGERFIYVVKDGKIEFRIVELGRRMGNRYEIISGVNNGDVVVVAGHNRVTNGMEVEIEK